MMASIGEFEIVRSLGEGGFSRVLLGRHRDTGELRAIKSTRGSSQAGSPQHRALQNEIALAPRILHENVVRVFASGQDSVFGEYLVEEFVDGPTLRAFIDSRSALLKYEDARQLMRGIASGMQAINSIMLHRDIHPGNIILSGVTPKIMDFGLAKLIEHETRTQTFKGIQHQHYKSPEGWKLERNTFLMDVYSVGIIFFELLTGSHPLQLHGHLIGPDWQHAHLFADRPRLRDFRNDIPPAISSLVTEMMAVARRDRPSWETVLDVLDHDREVPSWLRLPGDAGRRAQEAAERKRALLHRYDQEQEYFYRATCNRFLCELEDLVAEARDYLAGPVTTSRPELNSIRFDLGEQRITCTLFGRFKEQRVFRVGPVLGAGYLSANEELINIIVCSTGDDDFGGSWWVYPTNSPTTDETSFYEQLANAKGGKLNFTAHAVRGFSALLHHLFIADKT